MVCERVLRLLSSSSRSPGSALPGRRPVARPISGAVPSGGAVVLPGRGAVRSSGISWRVSPVEGCCRRVGDGALEARSAPVLLLPGVFGDLVAIGRYLRVNGSVRCAVLTGPSSHGPCRCRWCGHRPRARYCSACCLGKRRKRKRRCSGCLWTYATVCCSASSCCPSLPCSDAIWSIGARPNALPGKRPAYGATDGAACGRRPLRMSGEAGRSRYRCGVHRRGGIAPIRSGCRLDPAAFRPVGDDRHGSMRRMPDHSLSP